MTKQAVKNLVIFASGAGSNAQKIIDHFKKNQQVKTVLIVCNNPEAGVLRIAARENIPVLLLEKSSFTDTGNLSEIQSYAPDLIILAGFLWKIPLPLIRAFPERIINIHPALLPAHGGKGMYGLKVHAAVIASGDSQSGITIHYVDDKYDHGKIIFQASCTIEKNESPESLARKIHELEHIHYPETISRLLA